VRIALDTNILAYAEGINNVHKKGIALALIRKPSQTTTLIPVQVLGELFNVLTRKANKSGSGPREVILAWKDTFPLAQTTPEALLDAMDLSTYHKLSIWDSLILYVAARAGCRLLLSEDLQAGFTWGGVTVANPFDTQLHPLLRPLMSHSIIH